MRWQPTDAAGRFDSDCNSANEALRRWVQRRHVLWSGCETVQSGRANAAPSSQPPRARPRVDDSVGVFERSSSSTATPVMLRVHTRDKGVCGVFTREVAEAKVTQVNEFSRTRRHRLPCALRMTLAPDNLVRQHQSSQPQ
jgi:hypothetical protein